MTYLRDEIAANSALKTRLQLGLSFHQHQGVSDVQ